MGRIDPRLTVKDRGLVYVVRFFNVWQQGRGVIPMGFLKSLLTSDDGRATGPFVFTEDFREAGLFRDFYDASDFAWGEFDDSRIYRDHKARLQSDSVVEVVDIMTGDTANISRGYPRRAYQDL